VAQTIIGYARTSTADQAAGLAAQIRDLKAAGCEKLFNEQVSSAAARPQLDAAIEFCREGDVFVVTRIDRLARSVRNLLDIIETLTKRGVEARILANPELSGATGRLVLTIIGAIAEFERCLMLERQREGIATAKAVGKYKGRAPTARAKRVDVVRLASEGKTKAAIAAELGISQRSVFRMLESRKS
jgi:DNA invertase Pin-like site-specific DNA recombinase